MCAHCTPQIHLGSDSLAYSVGNPVGDIEDQEGDGEGRSRYFVDVLGRLFTVVGLLARLLGRTILTVVHVQRSRHNDLKQAAG